MFFGFILPEIWLFTRAILVGRRNRSRGEANSKQGGPGSWLIPNVGTFFVCSICNLRWGNIVSVVLMINVRSCPPTEEATSILSLVLCPVIGNDILLRTGMMMIAQITRLPAAIPTIPGSEEIHGVSIA